MNIEKSSYWNNLSRNIENQKRKFDEEMAIDNDKNYIVE